MLEIVLIILAGFLTAWVSILQTELNKARAEMDWFAKRLCDLQKKVDKRWD